jgi:diguanylate cyclase (GGDEF)-like protein
MLLDLDNFKEINDKFGHHSGDQVLCEVARRLKNTARESDTVARPGGEEFTLLFNSLKREEDIEGIISKIRNCLQPPIKIEDTEIYAHASIGVSLYPTATTDPDELIDKADHAMYREKARNGIKR